MEIDNIELSVEQADDNGDITVKELAREYLSKGSWTTIAFLYQDRKADGQFSEAKVTFRRYQKLGGTYKQRSKFNVSSKLQAERMINTLKKWYEL